jgi:predicted SprT family Zn-dependent metalloprotease
MYISIPRATVTGTAVERRKAMKEYFIEKMGGRCSDCGQTPVLKSVHTRNRSGKRYFAKKCNLEAHHTIQPGQFEAKNRLANLYVISGARPKEQKKQLRLFADNLQICILLCSHCHGKLHGKQKVSMHKY